MARTEVTIVETLRRRVVVEHPDDWSDDDAYAFVWTKYSDDAEIVLGADDFSDSEIFTRRMGADEDETPDYAVDEAGRETRRAEAGTGKDF